MPIIRSFWTGLRRYSSVSKSHKRNYDVILVGGGVMGLSSAYFLAKKIDPSSICVVERDRNVNIYFIPKKEIWYYFVCQFTDLQM